MSQNPFSHIDLRVQDMTKAKPFYDALLPLLGFNHLWGGESGWQGASNNEPFPSKAFFGFIEEPDHRPNSNRIAFWVADRETIDRVARILPELGSQKIEGPSVHTEYSESYYAVFFEDPSGNRLEVVHRLD